MVVLSVNDLFVYHGSTPEYVQHAVTCLGGGGGGGGVEVWVGVGAGRG